MVVLDELPSGVTFVSSNATEGVYDHLTHQWTGLELDPGETHTLSIAVTVNQDTAGLSLINTASIDAAETDPDDTNNQDAVQSLVTLRPAPGTPAVALRVSSTVRACRTTSRKSYSEWSVTMITRSARAMFFGVSGVRR